MIFRARRPSRKAQHVPHPQTQLLGRCPVMSSLLYRMIPPRSLGTRDFLGYQVGQLYSVAEASKNETGGGEGVEVLVNEPYEKDGEKGQYTHKIYHLQSKVPTFVRMLAPEGALNIHEKAWNAYPYCRTVSILPKGYFIADKNCIVVTHLFPQVHKLEPETWKHVEAIYIDIADRSQVLSKDYKAEEDPAKFKSIKTGRGPLGPNWKQELVNQKDCPYMCAYKLVTVKFKWWGLQNKVENFIHKQERRLFTNFHRQLFCWLDKWVDLTMDDIRRMEEETKRQLDEVSGGSQLDKRMKIKETVLLGTSLRAPSCSSGNTSVSAAGKVSCWAIRGHYTEENSLCS
uniref:Phosphatidylinositol transfer protein alpha isoform n=1 Tax=Piliocolobus tephrosceles TaxID=591936 RepID=A0A8C9H1D9_9PRIM